MNPHQYVVEIVSYATGQGADGFHFLDLGKMGLKFFNFSFRQDFRSNVSTCAADVGFSVLRVDH